MIYKILYKKIPFFILVLFGIFLLLAPSDSRAQQGSFPRIDYIKPECGVLGSYSFNATKNNKIYLESGPNMPLGNTSLAGGYRVDVYMDGRQVNSSDVFFYGSSGNTNPTRSGYNMSAVYHRGAPEGTHSYRIVLHYPANFFTGEPGGSRTTNTVSVTTISGACGSTGGGGGGGSVPTTLSLAVAPSGCSSDGYPRITVSWTGGMSGPGYQGFARISRIDNSTGEEKFVPGGGFLSYDVGSGSRIDSGPYFSLLDYSNPDPGPLSGRSYRYTLYLDYTNVNVPDSPKVTSANVIAPTCGSPPPPSPTITAETTALECSNGVRQVKVAWTRLSSADGYRIERVVNGAPAPAVNLTAAQAASGNYELIQNTTAGSNYHRVYALNSSGTTLANTTTTPVNIASCPAPPVDPVYSFIVDPPTAELDNGGNREFIAHARVDGSRISGSIGLTWSISDPSLGTLSEATENSSRTTIFTATSNCTLLQSDRTVVLTARATINNRIEIRTSTININSCNQSGSGSTEITTINGLIIGNQIKLDGSNISIIYDGRIITNPPLGFSEIIVPTIREGR